MVDVLLSCVKIPTLSDISKFFRKSHLRENLLQALSILIVFYKHCMLTTRNSVPMEFAMADKSPSFQSNESEHLIVRGACEHNLKAVDIAIPKKRLVVFTGMSGSGKSSLAFDTIFAEGQRRYVESLSAYARQFLGQMEKPKYDSIRGLSPTISIEQKTVSKNPRSTVGTITEIHDYMRVLFCATRTSALPSMWAVGKATICRANRRPIDGL